MYLEGRFEIKQEVEKETNKKFISFSKYLLLQRCGSYTYYNIIVHVTYKHTHDKREYIYTNIPDIERFRRWDLIIDNVFGGCHISSKIQLKFLLK